jgi:hypothetical protein
MLNAGLGPVTKYLSGRIALRNLYHGRHEQFRIWEQSRSRQRFLQIGKEGDFPRLSVSLADLVRVGGPNTLRTHDKQVMDAAEYMMLRLWTSKIDGLWDGLRSTIKVAA